MNATDRNAGEYAHRGQRLTMFLPNGMTAEVGHTVSITFSATFAWIMPATVVEIVQGIKGETIVTVEPGAAVREPAKWYIVDPLAAIREFATVNVPRETQGDLFAL